MRQLVDCRMRSDLGDALRHQVAGTTAGLHQLRKVGDSVCERGGGSVTMSPQAAGHGPV